MYRSSLVGILILLGTVFTSASTTEGAVRLPPSPTVVVADFGRYGGNNSRLMTADDLSIIGSNAAELVTKYLMELSPFDLVNYDLEGVTNEIALTSSGVMSADSLHDFALSHNVRYVVYGTVVDIAYGDSHTNIPMLLHVNSDKITSRISIQLYDSQTGDILMTAQGTGVSEAVKSRVVIDESNTVDFARYLSTDNISKSLDKAAKNAVDLLLKRIYGDKIPKRNV